MGDRANVFVRGTKWNPETKQETPADVGVWLYGHWSGHNLPKSVQEALRIGRGRWQDAPMLQHHKNGGGR